MTKIMTAILVIAANFICNESKDQISHMSLKVEASKPMNQSTSSEEDKFQSASTTISTTSTSIGTSTIKEITGTTPWTTTSLATTTIAQPLIKNTNGTETRTKLKAYLKNPPENYFCKCDLMSNFCDINCCCDIDCNSEMLKAFECVEDRHSFQEYQFQYGLPSCRINEGWLCVFKDNSKTKFKKVYNAARLDQKYSWPNSVFLQSEKSRNYYKIGDPILLYNEITEEVETLDLPFSLINSMCQANEPLSYLQSFNKECIMSFDKAQNFYKTFVEKITTSSILRIPKNAVSNEIMTEKIDNGGDCIKSILFFCVDNASSCRVWTNKTRETQSEYYFSSVVINIHHNFTSIERSEIYLFENLAVEENLWQNFEVNFLYLKETNNSRYNVSGPLGYNAGSPVIVGKLVLANDSAENMDKQWILNYFHANSSIHKTDFHIHIPGSAKGDCTHEDASLISFGENYMMHCNIRLNDTTIDSSTNFTAICSEIQKRAFQFLLGNHIISAESGVYVSEFGFPRNRTEHWVKVTTTNFEPMNILAVHNHDSNSFSCQNMIIGIRYLFFTANIEISGVPNQNIIKKANFEIGSRVDLSFKLGEDVFVPISFHVMFYDLTDFSYSSRASRFQTIEYLSGLIIMSALFKIKK